MNNKRFQVAARIIGKNTLVKGYYVYDFSNKRHMVSINTCAIWHIDPETIEPIAVPVFKECHPVGDYKCPNCKAGFYDNPDTRTPYCGNCGQRLDWSMEGQNG